MRQAERDVAGGAQMLEQGLGLKEDRDGARFGRQGCNVGAVQPDAAGRR